MNRRDFITANADGERTTPRTMAKRQRVRAAAITTGLTPITGNLGAERAYHLLRRTQFGATPTEVSSFSAMNATAAVDAILTIPPSLPPHPVDPNTGQTWIGQVYNSSNDGNYFRYMQAWWLDRMYSASGSIIEKMTLFWHQFIANDWDTVGDSRYHYKQNSLFRQYALGNFKDLIREVTLDPCMLRYLNGNSNNKTRPNENYARELQELFTIGKGPEVSMGNYTNYTEQDVQAAAKVLTGWRETSSSVTSYFTLSLHDITNKQFSSAYNNAVILGRNNANAGIDELNDLLTMIFNQAATAKYLVRKLHYWFVGFDITPTVESNIINPLAAQLQADNYNILPTIRRLLLSEYFYDAGNVGGLLKNPIDFVLSFIKRSRVTIPTDPVQRYNAFNAMRSLSATYGMEVFNPPGVAGWEAYHQEPGFQKLWINSVTLPQRNGFTDSFVNGSSTGGYTFGFNAVTFLPTICSTPADANAVVQAFVNEFLVFPLTTAQINHLRDVVFLNNQTTAWWTTQWNNYIANPTNTTATNTVRDRLRPLLRVIFRMAEYQIM